MSLHRKLTAITSPIRFSRITSSVTTGEVRRGGARNPAYQILVKTDNAGTSTDTQFTLPATGTYTIDWGDGTVEEKTGAATHDYGVAGEYVIRVTGGLTAITFNNGGDRLKLLEIQNWGDIVWSTFANAWYGCSNMDITATDLPNSASVTTFSNAWRGCSSLTSFPLLDSSNVTSFAAAWFNCSSLTSFPLLDSSNVMSFTAAWYVCSSLTSFSLLSFAKMTNGTFCFYGVTLPTETWSQLLINTEATNQNNNVQWGGGNSKYSAGAAATARAALVADHTWSITDGGFTDPTAHEILVKTDNAGTSSSTQFTLPATGTYTIDWGDGTVEEKTGAATHDYGVAGEYVIRVTGGLTAITFNNGGDKLKLLEIQNWGDIVWSTFANAWYGCSNMDITATDLPNSSNVTSFNQAWQRCSSLTSFPLLDSSNVTNFSRAWQGCNSLTSFPLLDSSNVTSFSSAWLDCTSLTSFPLLDSSNVTSFDSAWTSCSSLTSFPLLNSSNVMSFDFAWQGCSSLTSFPLLNSSNVMTFAFAWFGCSSLTSFPLLDSSNVTSFGGAWANCSSLTSFPLLSFTKMTSGSFCFSGVTLPTETWSQLLINTEATNQNNNVQWHGGNSKYNSDGGVARAALVADHTWSITDGGLES